MHTPHYPYPCPGNIFTNTKANARTKSESKHLFANKLLGSLSSPIALSPGNGISQWVRMWTF